MLTGSQGNIGIVIQERKKLDDGRMPVEPLAEFRKVASQGLAVTQAFEPRIVPGSASFKITLLPSPLVAVTLARP
jgi:hypothetical protein